MSAQRQSHFVGRQGELAKILEAVGSNPPEFNIINVWGVGGIGKTTLIRKLSNELAARDIPAAFADLEVASDPLAILRAWRSQLGDLEPQLDFSAFDKLTSSLEAARTKLERASQAVANGLQSAAASTGPVGSFVTGAIGDERVQAFIDRHLGASDARLLADGPHRLADAFLDALRSRAQTTALCVDVYERCSPTVDGWIRSLIGNDRTTEHLVFVVAGKDPLPNIDHSWSARFGPVMLSVELAALDAADCRDYCVRRGVQVGVDELVALSGGLPWRLELIVDGATVETGASAVGSSPELVERQAIKRFLAQLGEDASLLSAVETAGVLGEFDLDLWAEASGSPVSMLRDASERFGFIELTPTLRFRLNRTVAELISRHARETQPDRWRRVHDLAAATYASRRGEVRRYCAEWFDLLAKELGHVAAVTPEAVAIRLDAEFVPLVGSFLGDVGRLLDSIELENPLTSATLRLFRARLALASGRLDEAQSTCSELMTDAVGRDVQSAARLVLIELHHRKGDVARAISIAESGLEALGQEAPMPRAFFFTRLSELYGMVGDQTRSDSFSQAAEALLPEVSEPLAEAHIHLLLSHMRIFRCDYSTAARNVRRALDLYSAVGDDTGRAAALSAEAWLHSLEGSFDSAFSSGLESMRLLRGADDRFASGLVALSRADALRRSSEARSAVAWNRRAVTIFDSCGSRLYSAIARTQLGAAMIDAGDLSTARHELEQAVALEETIGEHASLGAAQFFLACTYPHGSHQQRELLLSAQSSFRRSQSPYAHLFARLIDVATDVAELDAIKSEALLLGFRDLAASAAVTRATAEAVDGLSDWEAALSLSAGFNIYYADRSLAAASKVLDADGMRALAKRLQDDLAIVEAERQRSMALPRTRKKPALWTQAMASTKEDE